MNKLIILLIIFIGIILVIITIFAFTKGPTTKVPPKPTTATTPSPQTYPSGFLPKATPSANLSIISTDPANNSTNLPVNQIIKIVFNRNFSIEEIDFQWEPIKSYTTQVDGTTLIATPKTQLNPGSSYDFFVIFKQTGQPSSRYHFTTAGPTPTGLPDTFPSGAAQQQEDYNRQHAPDVFLANKTPYSTVDFNLPEAGFREGHYYFSVTLKGDPTASKNAFLVWLRSLGLTDTQIQSLDIQYW